MLESLIAKKLLQLNLPMVKTGDTYVMTTCLNPRHNDTKPSFGINTSTGRGGCFSCGFKVEKEFWTDGKLNAEQLDEIEREMMYTKLLHKEEEESDKVLAIPPKFSEVPEGYRGLSKETLDKFGMYICKVGKFRDRIIFPMSDNYFDSRALGDAQPKYLRAKGYRAHKHTYPFNILNESQSSYVVVVEGIMDTVSLHQDGINGMCNFGVSKCNINIPQLVECGIETLYIMFDDDKAGKEATYGTRNEDGRKERIGMLNNKDLLEYFEVKHAKELPILSEFYLSSCKDYSEYLENKEKE